MEFGGVGSGLLFMTPFLLVGTDLPATAAKLSLPAKLSPPRGFGISIEAVRPAKAIAMLDVAVLLTGAMMVVVGQVVARH